MEPGSTLLLGPTGIERTCSVFRFWKPKDSVYVPSGFWYQPSNTGLTPSPCGCWRAIGFCCAPAAPASTVTEEPSVAPGIVAFPATDQS